MDEESQDIAGSGAERPRGDEQEYPKAPGASKMPALERIKRSVEHQSEATPDRAPETDARQGDDEGEGQPRRDSDR